MGDTVGRFMPPVQSTDDTLPFTDGSVNRQILFGERQFTVPVNVLSTSQALLRTQLRNLIIAMNPKRGKGIVRVTSPLGDIREIEALYLSGLDMDENIEKSGRFGQQTYITFKCNDPFWRDQNSITNSWQVSASPNFFPFFPLRLTSSQIAVTTTINNVGDVESWPVWTVRGPGGGSGGIVLQNLTSGSILSFMTTILGSSEFITIDTRPGVKLVTKNDGTNLFGDLDPTSVLWPLEAGSNSINLELTSAIAGTTALTISYRQKYLSP
jgi:phage-related protein